MGLCPACAFGVGIDVYGDTLEDRPAARDQAPEGEDRLSGPPGGAPSFGKYTQLEEIDRGGMGVVFKAWDTGAKRAVALKMIRSGALASKAEVHRFYVEMEAAGALDHPNIAPIWEVGEHAGHPYFTMKLMTGGSLADKVNEYRGDPRRAAELVETIAMAVHHAHQRGILHRDLKPANILLDENGKPHVADFGLAKRVDRKDGLSHTGQMVGTPSYMAPEQAGGSAQALTTAADVYSLGVILYELVTGQPPFDGETLDEIIEKVKKSPPPDPRSIEPRVDRDLAYVCLKCLEKSPEDRYGSAEELATDLRRYQDGESIVRRRFLGRAWRWCIRHPVTAGLLLTAALFLVIMTWRTVSLTREQEALKRAQIIAANRLSAAMVAGTVLSHIRDLSDAVSRVAEDEAISRALEEGDSEKLQAICQAAYERYEDPSAGLKSGDNSPFYVWFVADKNGLSRGNSRNDPRNILSARFDLRDYFKGARALSQRGSRETYISNAFKGIPGGLYEFAISTPIYRSGGNREWIGVLGAAVATTAKLGSLVLDDDRNRVALAAPWDPNRTLEQDESAPPDPPEYLLLRHPGYSKRGEAIALDNEQIRRIGKGSQENEQHILHPLRLPSEPWVGSSDHYEDPLGRGNSDDKKGSLMPPDPRFAGRWLAGFAAVGYTGFVVIVQTREDEALGSEKKLGGQLAKWAGIASAPSLLLMLVAAGYERRRSAARAHR
jgi:serine/threonine-protein kinase